jgi:hypothetical protein
MCGTALWFSRVGLVMDFLGIMLIMLELYGHDFVMLMKPQAVAGPGQGQPVHFNFIPMALSFLLELGILLVASSVLFFLPALCLAAMINLLTPMSVKIAWVYAISLGLSCLGIAGFVVWQLRASTTREDFGTSIWRKLFIYLIIFYYILYSFILTIPVSFCLAWDNLWNAKKSPSFVGLVFLILGFFLHLIGAYALA